MGCAHSSSVGVTLHPSDLLWRKQPSRDEVKGALASIGIDECDPSQFEFRALLEYPVAQAALLEYIKKMPSGIELCFHGLLEIQSFGRLQPTRRNRHVAAKILFDRFILKNDYLKKDVRTRLGAILTKNSESTTSAIYTEQFAEVSMQLFRVLHKEVFELFKFSAFYAQMYVDIRDKYNAVTVKDFDYTCILGKGGFGVVCRVKKHSTGAIYAMKIQSKQELCMRYGDNARRATLEMHTLSSLSNPYIAKLSFAFQTSSLLIMVMEASTGCDLSRLLHTNGPLKPETVQFIMAELVSALSYLHRMELHYRDLKPANLLLDRNGHVKLIDFGAVVDLNGKIAARCAGEKFLALCSLDESVDPFISASSAARINAATSQNGFSFASDIAQAMDHGRSYETADNLACWSSPKQPPMAYAEEISRQFSPEQEMALNKDLAPGLKRAYSYVGTQGYMAPEMMILKEKDRSGKNIGYTKAVDWWSFGVTMYKLLVGDYPFKPSPTHELPLRAVLQGTVDYSALKDNPTAVNMISNFLQVEDTKRLGYGESGSMDVALHPYFASIDWFKLEEKKLPPPPVLTESMFEKACAGQREREFQSLEHVLSVTNRYCWLQFSTKLSPTFETDKEKHRHFDSWQYASQEAIAAEMNRVDVRVGITGDSNTRDNGRTDVRKINHPGGGLRIDIPRDARGNATEGNQNVGGALSIEIPSDNA